MAHTRTWDATYEAAPAGTTNVSAGDDRIRDFKLDIRERLNIDHYHDPAGTDDDHGEHRKVTFHEPVTSPTAVTNKGFLFMKDVSAKGELHFLDEDDNEIQLTKAGLLNPGLLLDEDDMASDSDEHAPTQQSVKEFVDTFARVYVNNADGNPNMNALTVDVDATIVESTWESIGPTGAGADNTWTPLNGVPTGVDWIELTISSIGTDGPSGSNLYTRVYARKNGGSGGAGGSNMINNIADYSDGSGKAYGASISTHKIPVDGDVVFDLYWVSTFTGPSITILLTGYGYNPT